MGGFSGLNWRNGPPDSNQMNLVFSFNYGLNIFPIMFTSKVKPMSEVSVSCNF